MLGVMAGLGMIRTMNELDLKTRHPITIVNSAASANVLFHAKMETAGIV